MEFTFARSHIHGTAAIVPSTRERFTPWVSHAMIRNTAWQPYVATPSREHASSSQSHDCIAPRLVVEALTQPGNAHDHDSTAAPLHGSITRSHTLAP
jgi:hypothetical protein